jgi:hypothetical protein
VRAVVLDAVNGGAEIVGRYVKGSWKRLVDAAKLTSHAEAMERKCGKSKGIQQFATQSCPRVARYGHVVHVFEFSSRGVQTVSDRVGRETGRMLDACESLLFDRCNQTAIYEYRCRRVTMIRVDS